ncbi:CRISPR-associated helicase Cas3 [Carbonactinospora thermoautotrophica]|uniref:CRISPR-associated helicase Cas3 n=1 Tax=Carbonactinospora thermoautotrophica TaxID=1469144 RepID=A0A132MLU7_9ACTN|nr:CRISPR-associated endonuclease Cas3'' [Carbonactinospora thermoautotrophica]KWW98832.1 CRISPR-associated helicase Cas3 [Carbonactinospora thermoautotrophica]
MIESGDGARPDVRAAWGKAENEPVPHPLICHAIDTAAVAERLLGVLVGPRCREELRAAFAPLGDADGWVAVFCGLHDLGKFSPVFQVQRVDLAKQLGELVKHYIQHLLPFQGVKGVATPHGLLTTVHLERLLVEWGAPKDTALVIAWALGGHHGYFPDAASVLEAGHRVGHHGGEQWAGLCAKLLADVARLWGLPAPETLPWGQVRVPLGAAIALAGLASVSDWIASDERNFRWVGSNVGLTSYLQEARNRAKQVTCLPVWSSWRLPEDAGLVTLSPTPTEQQVQEAVEQAMRRLKGPGIVLVEAPPGDGQAQAISRHAAVLARTLGLAGCYLVASEKVALRQAWDQVDEFVASSPKGIRNARLDGVGLSEAGQGRLAGEGQVSGTARKTSIRLWFMRTYETLSPFHAGTKYRFLRSARRSRHVFVRLLGLSNKVVVLDEIDTYSAYMSALLDRLLWWLGRLGVPVILFSTALPAYRRRDLVRSWRAGALGLLPKAVPEPPEVSRYPRVTWADAADQGVATGNVSGSDADCTVRLEHVPDDQLVDWVLDQARNSGRIAVVHNTVRRAKETYQKLKVALDDSLLAREWGDRQVTRHPPGPKSAGSDNRPERLVVVGNRVLEPDLRLNFDIVVSDLAPIDSLIQRMGWLCRSGGSRSSVTLVLTGVTDRPGGPRLSAGVASGYERLLLFRAWALLRDRAWVRWPDDVPGLIEAGYGDVPCPAGWERVWEKAAEKWAESHKRSSHNARAVYLPQPNDSDVLHTLCAVTERPPRPAGTRRGRRAARSVSNQILISSERGGSHRGRVRR